MRLHHSWTLPLAFLIAAGCDGFAGTAGTTGRQHSKPEGRTAMTHVRVRLIGADGKLGDPTKTPAVVLSDAEWRKRLTPEQYRIARGKDTERAFCGLLLNNKMPGMYLCVCCNLPLFESGTKFESGTGWPSFYQPVAMENIRQQTDLSHNMLRTEILCQRCGAHLGHVFDDGPRPTGRRYCLNSISLRFVAADKLRSLAGVPGAWLADRQRAD